MPSANTSFRTVCALLLGATASGCIVTSTNTTRDVGPRITASSLQEIHAGVTSEEWLIATFGEPTKRVRVETEGVDILRYDIDQRTTEGYYVFLVIAHASNSIERRSWWFEIKDGIVTRWWQADPATEAAADAVAK
ncbi:MAG: hypothetical protein EXS10_02950 [Phycisphaerales bacterium]|nr:hypothetical protein [Phycisphaerales bacterium]